MFGPFVAQRGVLAIVVAAALAVLGFAIASRILAQARESEGASRLAWVLFTGLVAGGSTWAAYFTSLAGLNFGTVAVYDAVSVLKLLGLIVVTATLAAYLGVLPWRPVVAFAGVPLCFAATLALLAWCGPSLVTIAGNLARPHIGAAVFAATAMGLCGGGLAIVIWRYASGLAHAMTREMGTLGKDVAAGLAARLDLTVVHHELIERIAERAGMRESEVHRFLEGEASLVERWKIDSKRLSRYTAQEILELAVKGNVLIRGWGATFLLRSVPHVICVRVCASMPFREQVMMQRLRIKDSAVARSEIQGNDAAHNGAIQKLFGIDWMEASLYAIVLNTARVPVEDCIEHVARLAQSPAFQETAQSRSTLMDELILSRVRFALDQGLRSRATLGNIAATVSGGKVALTGATSEKRLMGEAVRLVEGVEGVMAVESQIAQIVQGRSAM